MSYVDGFVLAVKKNKLAKYRKMATEAGKVWTKFGALQYFECKGNDLHPKHVKYPFTKTVKAKADEVVFFSFIIFKNKAHRNAVNKKVMNYFAKKYSEADYKDMPFDMKRMAYGGFQSLVEYKKH